MTFPNQIRDMDRARLAEMDRVAIINAEAELRVARGVNWLDANVTDWAQKIDLVTLDMGHGCRCVLGQLGGGQWVPEIESEGLTTSPFEAFLHGSLPSGSALDGIWAPVGDDANDMRGHQWAAWHGFDYTDDVDKVFIGYDALAPVWERVIAERQAARA